MRANLNKQILEISDLFLNGFIRILRKSRVSSNTIYNFTQFVLELDIIKYNKNASI